MRYDAKITAGSLKVRESRIIADLLLRHASSEECYLERLAVLPAAQRQGVGATLVRHGIEQARCLGIQKVGVAIIAEQTELARWYHGIGFTASGTRSFAHLPFKVAFLSYAIGSGGLPTRTGLEIARVPGKA